MFSLKFIFVSFIIVFCFQLNGQSCHSYLPNVKEDISIAKLCPEVMLDDLQKLKQALHQIHPDLFYYISKEQLDSSYRCAIKKVANELTVLEYCKTISVFLSTLKDSHTHFNPKSLIFWGPRNKGTFPFSLRKIGEKFYLESILGDQKLKGMEILEFNNISVRDIFRQSLCFSLIEGSAFSAQEEIATKGMSLAFSQMQSFKSSDSIQILYVNGDDTLTTFQRAHSKMELYLFKEQKRQRAVSYFFNRDNLAVLKISTFQPKNLNHFKREVSDFFEEVSERNCRELVIDLRDNPGGFIKAQEYLWSFLNFERKKCSIEHVYKRSDYDPFANMSFINKWRFKLKAKKEYPFGMHSDEYDFMRSELGTSFKISYSDLTQDQIKPFDGKCTLLINGLSMSSSVLFAGWFKDAERGEIVGSPCLGPMSGTFGSSVTINLPGTGLPVLISTVKFNPQHTKKVTFQPIFPDKIIEYSIDDIKLNQDPIFNYLKIEKSTTELIK